VITWGGEGITPPCAAPTPPQRSRGPRLTDGSVAGRQLIPNDKGAFQSIGLDSVAGLAVIALGLVLRKSAGISPVPPLITSNNPPWRVPREARKMLGGTTAYLLLAYIASGYGAVFCEQARPRDPILSCAS